MTRIREIVVDGVPYRWSVTPIDPAWVRVRVWHGREQILVERIRFDDPWLNYGPLLTGDPELIEQNFRLEPVRPRQVAELIRRAVGR
ncbi:hypothetical protein [Actinoplanes sp. NPDC049802]|uniref:hypothetical protein n=1 Tax=Actinoplanes sp. NPDC049802 TaxID=3154742 RepID=UPI0033D70238